MQLLCPRTALSAPNWTSHPAQTPALPWWEAVPGRADGSCTDNPWKGRFHQVFPLDVPRAAPGTSRAQVLSTAMHEQPLCSLKGGKGLSNLPCPCLWIEETLPSQTGFHFPKAAFEFWPQLCRLDTARTAHSPGFLCAISSDKPSHLTAISHFFNRALLEEKKSEGSWKSKNLSIGKHKYSLTHQNKQRIKNSSKT